MSKFWNWADKMGVETGRFPEREKMPAADRSHVAMAVNLDACIQCNLCVRACREVQVNDVIGMAGRGYHEKIVFDFDDPMGNSTCVACGECVQACPTGALMPSSLVNQDNVRTEYADRQVDSVCPYCGVGCQLTYNIKDDKLLYVTGKDGPANENRLCVKGRFGFDYVHNPQRITKPMIRKEGVPKTPHEFIDPANPWTHFREATWDEALDKAAQGFLKIREQQGPKGLAGFGSAKCSNEEAYLFQKLIRTGFGTNNVDHCTRLCHASSVAALLEGVGSASVSATFNEVKNSDVIVVIGANPTENHPVAATYFKQAAKRGAKLVVMDPRGQALKRHAWRMMQFKNGADVAMLNAMLNVIVTENLYDKQYVQTYTEGFEAFAEHVKDFTPEEMAPICGIEADTLARSRAHLCARRECHHLLGHGRIAAHPRHRQCALPDRAVADHRPDRPPRHRPASAARPEQRAGRVRRRPDPDVPAGLQVDRESGNPRRRREEMGRAARSEARADRGRDHGRDPCRRDQGHVHHGRKSRDVGPRPQPRARGARASRSSGGAGHFPHRDRGLCRRGAAVIGLAGEGWHRHQHQSSGADGPQGAAAAGRGAAKIGGSPSSLPSGSASTGPIPIRAMSIRKWHR